MQIRILIAACALLLLVTASASAQQPLTASFTFAPAQPVAGQNVTFTSTSTGLPDATVWDLDNDGTYDDGSGTTARRAFPAGAHMVRLKVRRGVVGAVEATSYRFVTVKAGAVEPQPTVSAPNLNLPPVATLSRECTDSGICFGPLVKLNVPKTFDASESVDNDGSIVRYQWDVDGNGSFERDTGATPKLTVTVNDEKPAVLRLRVTDDKGATAETTMALKKLEPACVEKVFFERAVATSPCLRLYEIEDGKQYRSEFPVTVNGVTITPAEGKNVVVNVLGAGLLRRFEVMSGDAVATFPFKGQGLKLQSGPVRWTYENDRLTNVGRLDGQSLNGLKISGAPDSIELPTRGVARTSVYLKLPAAFGAPTSAKPVVLTAGAPLAEAANADDAFSFEVPNASIGPIGLNLLKVTYDGEGLWEIEADLDVPVLGARIHGKAGIYKGDFNYAGVEANFPSPGMGPLGPIFIQRIKFRVEVSPKKSECVPHLGVEDVGVPPIVQKVDFGVPTFALCGEVGLTAGPRILGAQAISLDAGLGLATYDDRPSVMRAFGDLKVISIPFASATFEAHTDGFVKVMGKFSYGWDGFASVSGHISLGMLGDKFNAEGGVKACLEFVDFCRGVNALISSKGMAVCMVIDYEIDDWRPGFGYKWGDSLPDAYFSGCSLGPYRETITRASAASVGERSVELPAGLPGTVIAARGVSSAPRITLVGPRGERVSSPADGGAFQDKRFLLLPNEGAKLTQVAISHPAGGRWRVIVEDGTLESLKVAHGVETPRISASVAGSGHAKTLRYKVEERPGQTVSFIERGASVSGVIGDARGAQGSLRFTPAGGAGERREILALVEQDGMASEPVVVARYTAPSALKPGTVGRLRATRRSGGLAVTWRGATGARRHLVTVALSDGRRLVRQVNGTRTVIRGVPRGVKATVVVRGLCGGGVSGPAKRVRVR
ncbi:PKD domain-containing protein [Solirubrobacter taibaiensis]|nr:PKD domain-containing protein [Solirubrobacter taibaiensis]